MPQAIVLKASTYRRMPWKNGGGETVEIAISPEGASVGEFDWRVSMATVAADGPFSIFPGIDRTLSILKGNGMSLAIDGRDPVFLTQQSDPLAFAADVAVSATLADGAIIDLNVMTRRGTLNHSVQRIRIDGSREIGATSTTALLFCHQGRLEFQAGKEGGEIGEGDSLLLTNAAATALRFDGQALCYFIAIHVGGTAETHIEHFPAGK
jgi:environmental stress-induced protein Ves